MIVLPRAYAQSNPLSERVDDLGSTKLRMCQIVTFVLQPHHVADVLAKLEKFKLFRLVQASESPYMERMFDTIHITMHIHRIEAPLRVTTTSMDGRHDINPDSEMITIV